MAATRYYNITFNTTHIYAHMHGEHNNVAALSSSPTVQFTFGIFFISVFPSVAHFCWHDVSFGEEEPAGHCRQPFDKLVTSAQIFSVD